MKLGRGYPVEQELTDGPFTSLCLPVNIFLSAERKIMFLLLYIKMVFLSYFKNLASLFD